MRILAVVPGAPPLVTQIAHYLAELFDGEWQSGLRSHPRAETDTLNGPKQSYEKRNSHTEVTISAKCLQAQALD